MGEVSKEGKVLIKKTWIEKRWGENIRQCFIFSAAVHICSCSSCLLSFIDDIRCISTAYFF